MSLIGLVLIWALIVIVSMAMSVLLAHRWGRDPFGWAMLAAGMGPMAIVALLGTRTGSGSTAAVGRMMVVSLVRALVITFGKIAISLLSAFAIVSADAADSPIAQLPPSCSSSMSSR